MSKGKKQTSAADVAAEVNTENASVEETLTVNTVDEVNAENASVEETLTVNTVDEVNAENASVEETKKVLIRFTKSPTGTFRLAYNEFDEVEFPVAQAAELIDAGFAVAVGSDPDPEV